MDVQEILGLPNIVVTQQTVNHDPMTFTIGARTPAIPCPHCHQTSTRIHSYYTRTVTDRSIGDRAVVLHLRVRRFRCPTPTCPARTFTEQLPDVVPPRHHRTVRAQRLLTHLALSLGGAATARVALLLRMPVSATTVRRWIRTAPLPPVVAPKVLGVDDFAWRKGQRYGTILVDLSTHRPIDVLPDRSADTLAAWLQAHPGVDVISRDRAGAYADGATRGAPAAQQVADRFHLVHNLRAMTERLLDREHAAVRDTDAAMAARTANAVDGAAAVQLTAPRDVEQHQLPELPAPAQQRQARFRTVQALHAQGESIHRIAWQVGISRNTVRKYLRAPMCPTSAARPRRPRLLDPFVTYLHQRWTEGCTNSAQLYREIKLQGFAGATTVVRDWVRQQREPSADSPTRRQSRRASSARTISWLLVRSAATLNDAEQSYLAALQTQSDTIAAAYPLIQAFGSMIRERQPDQLEPWLQRAEQSQQPEIRTFAAGLRRDQQAVANALVLEWSNGPTEGAITRLKFIKRSSYGRASFETLRRRVLLGA